MAKFVMSQAVCAEGMERLKENGITDIYVANDGDPNNYIGEMKDADAVIIRIAKMDKNAIENSPNLKVIGRTGVGYDSVDVAAATAAGIPVVITPGANAHSVAEHSVALMMALSKDMINAHEGTCKGLFSSVRNQGRCTEILGKRQELSALEDRRQNSSNM